MEFITKLIELKSNNDSLPILESQAATSLFLQFPSSRIACTTTRLRTPVVPLVATEPQHSTHNDTMYIL